MIRWRYLAFIILKLDLNIISVKHIEVFQKITLKEKKKKNTPVNTDVINQTHGKTCLVLLPSRPDTLHKLPIVLAITAKSIIYYFLVND